MVDGAAGSSNHSESESCVYAVTATTNLDVLQFHLGNGDTLTVKSPGRPQEVFGEQEGPDGLEVAAGTTITWQANGDSSTGTGYAICPSA